MEQKTEFLFRKTPRASFGKQREENYKVRKWTVKRTGYWIHEALRGDFFFFGSSRLRQQHRPRVKGLP